MESNSVRSNGHSRAAVSRLKLKEVTLCAATSVNVDATIAALAACLKRVEFADCVLLTDATVTCAHENIRIVPIRALKSSRDYSHFILNELIGHVDTSHCLIVQWDGFVLDAGAWQDRFLDFDYIGAPWPQFHDAHDVGNGGFSLRSRKLLEACLDPEFVQGHPEDIAICRTNRRMLEDKYGLRFGKRDCAAQFAFERGGYRDQTFGFHGVFNMMDVLGTERFWAIYFTLDDRSTAFVDYRNLMRKIGYGSNTWIARLKFTRDWLKHCAVNLGKRKKKQ